MADSMTTKRLKSEDAPTDFAAPLSDEERDELEVLLESNYPDGTLGGAATCLHGFFTSVISGPLIKPTEWLGVVFGDSFDRKWKNRDQLHRAIDLIMRFNNEVANGLMSDDSVFCSSSPTTNLRRKYGRTNGVGVISSACLCARRNGNQRSKTMKSRLSFPRSLPLPLLRKPVSKNT